MSSKSNQQLINNSERKENIDDRNYGSNQKIGHKSNDPLIAQLPKELKQFVKYPEDHNAKLAYVERSSGYALFHNVMAGLCCCWSMCRMVVVQQGQIALTQYGDEQEILLPGRHVLLSPFNSLIGINNETQPVIEHGPIKIIQVRRGELGYGVDMKTGKPELLAQGKHVIKNNAFVWRGFINLRNPRTKLDELEVIRVETGNIGYCYRGGTLQILQPGLHLITPPDRFGDFLSTQLSILDLPESVHDTSDYVPLSIVASVFYRVVNPKKALLRIQNVRKQIMETSTATLAGIIRASSLSDIASSSTAFHNEKKDKLNKDQKQAFFQHVHDEFISTLADHVKEEWGIEIQNIRIESLKINDETLRQNISRQAIDVSKQHNRYLMLQKQQAIVVKEAQTKSTQNQIDTEAQTGSTRELARAEADSMIIRAKARKEAKRLEGQGEKEYAKLLESTFLGKQLALMQIQSDTMKGLKQVAYVPHLPNILSKHNGIFENKKFKNYSMVKQDDNDENFKE